MIYFRSRIIETMSLQFLSKYCQVEYFHKEIRHASFDTVIPKILMSQRFLSRPFASIGDSEIHDPPTKNMLCKLKSQDVICDVVISPPLCLCIRFKPCLTFTLGISLQLQRITCGSLNNFITASFLEIPDYSWIQIFIQLQVFNIIFLLKRQSKFV